MLFFVEGRKEFVEEQIKKLNKDYSIDSMPARWPCNISFNEIVEGLHALDKTQNYIFINFFSETCKFLPFYLVRGLERIALTFGAIELNQMPEFNCSDHLDTSLVDHHLHYQEHQLAKKHSFPGIGRFKTGNILIVGDKPGPKSYGRNLPFVGNTGSGLWLLQQLEIEEQPFISEANLYWINSRDCYSKECSNSFVADLKPTKIIALGNNAEAWCSKISEQYEIIKIPHPQFWKRFKNKELYPLMEKLLECQKIAAA